MQQTVQTQTNLTQPIAAPTPEQVQPAQTARSNRGFKYHFYRSTYITVGWNWFMMLAGVSAEAVLTFSVIYSCARLLPSLHTPIWLDNLVFVAQMVALDVGGLSLRKMANMAQRDGNTSGAQFAGRVSNALITIMVLNVVLSVLQGVAKLDPQVVSIVEGCLLVARAVLAVLYASVVHSLREDDQTEQAMQPGVQASEIEQQIGGAIADLQAKFEQQLSNLATQIKQMPASQPINMDALTATIVANLKQKVVVSEHREQPQIEQQSCSPQTAKQGRTVNSRVVRANTSKGANANRANILALPSRTEGANTQEAIYRLLEDDETLGARTLARMVSVAPATAQKYRERFFIDRGEQ